MEGLLSMGPVRREVSGVTYHMSGVRCQVSGVTYHMSAMERHCLLFLWIFSIPLKFFSVPFLNAGKLLIKKKSCFSPATLHKALNEPELHRKKSSKS